MHLLFFMLIIKCTYCVLLKALKLLSQIQILMTNTFVQVGNSQGLESKKYNFLTKISNFSQNLKLF